MHAVVRLVAQVDLGISEVKQANYDYRSVGYCWCREGILDIRNMRATALPEPGELLELARY
jgi:hypothetical protein